METAYLVCLDVPEGTEFGIDYQSYNTGHKFKGVRNIPTGLHLIFYSNQNQGIRQGCFINVDPGDINIRSWCKKTEELKFLPNLTNRNHLEASIRSQQMDPYLGIYPNKYLKSWKKLTSYISNSVLSRCRIDLNEVIYFNNDDDIEPKSSMEYYSNIIQFTNFQIEKFSDEISSDTRTKLHFDHSIFLESLLTSKYGNSCLELLGELQLSFILFLLLSSYQALQQWKLMVSTLCNSEQCLNSSKELALGVVNVLYVQMKQLPTDFFHNDLSKENFLVGSIASLLEILDDDQSLEQPIRRGVFKIQNLMETRFHYRMKLLGSYAFADGESSPVLVMPEELASSNQDDKENEENLKIATDLLWSLST